MVDLVAPSVALLAWKARDPRRDFYIETLTPVISVKPRLKIVMSSVQMRPAIGYLNVAPLENGDMPDGWIEDLICVGLAKWKQMYGVLT